MPSIHVGSKNRAGDERLAGNGPNANYPNGTSTVSNFLDYSGGAGAPPMMGLLPTAQASGLLLVFALRPPSF